MLIFRMFNKYHSVNNSCEFGCDRMTHIAEIKEVILVSLQSELSASMQHKIYFALKGRVYTTVKHTQFWIS